MKVLFVHSETLDNKMERTDIDHPLGNQIDVQSGISYISSLLTQHGHHTNLFVFSGQTPMKNLDETVRTFKPRMICFTAVFREYEMMTKVAAYIKLTYPEIYLLAGGPHMTLNPDLAIEESFDAVCIGEGEFPTLELVQQLEHGESPSGIQNLWLKIPNGVEKNPTREFLQDLDVLPFPDREMWQKWIKNPNTPHTIIVGRGCPFDCTYCSNHVLRQVAKGKYVRFRSPANIIAELTDIMKKFPDADIFYFEAEAINLDLRFLTEFCFALEEFNKTLSKKIFYGANFRIVHGKDFTEVFQLFGRADFSF